MPLILPSHAPYPKAVLGWDGTQYRVLAVDDGGNVQVGGPGLLSNYLGKIMLRRFTVTALLGTNILNAGGPAGTAEWVITAMFLMNRTNAMTSSALAVVRGGTYYYVAGTAALAAYVALDWSGEVVLVAGDTLAFIYRGCQVNDQLEGIAHGYIRAA